MIVMPSNNTGKMVRDLARKYPGRIASLMSPGGQRAPIDGCGLAFDNACFGAFKNGTEWDFRKWMKMMDWAVSGSHNPMWALCPDSVGDITGTLNRWDEFYWITASYGWPVAFAVQDGMRKEHVPKNASVVFIGGSTDWKWETLRYWCDHFSHVHVGRVNTYRRLWQSHDAGAKSIDGTGWPRGDQRQKRGLEAYLMESSGDKVRELQGILF
jgi:hypothetical protein